ncbi:hypothetical protein H310_14051 [Aphanomyces invadans]|uniref:Uncharacterized protein n=1 Tax=Aphanomyces invadans TaxID=157072 RepID=A0A024TBJ9_9STRA|nr:hypothetical protein H310_14051 [Aphanomyces invadans]ETV91374.1 hypothetical protein H310_14051 [Aphanomyces invadans]|eukprot:XP_008880002.1 hypothetical protein H310_14051 [Aphanomyces invadans]
MQAPRRGAVGRPSDPVWQFFMKLPVVNSLQTTEDAGGATSTAKFARPRAKCMACGCIMIGQARQLKAHHARCSRSRDTPHGDGSAHDASACHLDNDDNDDMQRIPTIKHQLSAAEKLLVVKCHAYFKAEKQKEKLLVHRNPPWQTRARVSKCLGISQKTVSHVITEWNRFKDPTFQHRVVPVPPPAPTTTTMQLLHDYTDDVETYMESRNAAELPVTAAHLCKHLETCHGVQVDVVKMRAFLRKLHYVPGPRVHGRRSFVKQSTTSLACQK